METTKVSLIAIVRGKFSPKGNFSGYNSNSVRVHIPALMMKDFGYEAPAEGQPEPKISFPFYATVQEREFTVLNDDGEPVMKKDVDGNDVPETFVRLQAGSIWKTSKEAKDAKNADALLNAEADAELYTAMGSLGLTEETLKQLQVSPF